VNIVVDDYLKMYSLVLLIVVDDYLKMYCLTLLTGLWKRKVHIYLKNIVTLLRGPWNCTILEKI
jgi:hypothetical protein